MKKIISIDNTHIRRRIVGYSSIKVFLKENFKFYKIVDAIYWRGYFLRLSYWEDFDNKDIKIHTPALEVYNNDSILVSIFILKDSYDCLCFGEYMQNVKRINDVLEIIDRKW